MSASWNVQIRPPRSRCVMQKTLVFVDYSISTYRQNVVSSLDFSKCTLPLHSSRAWDWRDDCSVHRACSQVWGPGFDPKNPHETCQLWWYALVIPVLGMETEWIRGSLASQASLIVSSRPMRECVSKEMDGVSVDDTLFCILVFISKCTCGPHVHAPTQEHVYPHA